MNLNVFIFAFCVHMCVNSARVCAGVWGVGVGVGVWV